MFFSFCLSSIVRARVSFVQFEGLLFFMLPFCTCNMVFDFVHLNDGIVGICDMLYLTKLHTCPYHMTIQLDKLSWKACIIFHYDVFKEKLLCTTIMICGLLWCHSQVKQRNHWLYYKYHILATFSPCEA